jgi:hypothetical protein
VSLLVSQLDGTADDWIASVLTPVTGVDGIELVSAYPAVGGGTWVVTRVSAASADTLYDHAGANSAVLGLSEVLRGGAPSAAPTPAGTPRGGAAAADDAEDRIVYIAVACGVASVIAVGAAAAAYVTLRKKSQRTASEQMQSEMLIVPSANA